MKIKWKLLWSSLAVSLISVPTIFSLLSTNNKKQVIINQEIANSITPYVNAPTITAKTQVTDVFINNNPSEIAYILNNLPITNQSEIKKYLSYLFDGITTLDTTKYEIKDLKALANGIEGTLCVNFAIYEKDVIGNNSILAKMYEGDFNLNTGLVKGITKLNTYHFIDNTNNYQTIVNALRTDPINYLSSNNIVINFAKGINPSQVTFNSVNYDEFNKIITIDGINITNAINTTTLTPLTIDGPITIKAMDAPVVLGPTNITYNNAYLFDSSFAIIDTASKFERYIKTNKTNSTVIDLIISKFNVPNNAAISVGNITLNTNSVDVEFNINQYYDDNNKLVNKNKTFVINYATFSVATKVTYVKTENILSNKNYAYEYTKDELLALVNDPANKIIINPFPNSTASFVDEPIYDNRTGMISANIRLDKYYNEYGQEAANKEFTNIKFKAPNVVLGPTYIQRNTTPVSETINKIDSMSDVDKITWAKKYITLINPTPTTNYNSFRVEKVSSYPTRSVVSSTDALYKVSTKLVNYIVNDQHFTMNTNPSSNDFVVYINAKVNLATKVKDNVVANGINTSAPINLLTVKEVVENLNNAQDKVKQWIVDNFTSIFENYDKTPAISDILSPTFSRIENQPNSVEVSLTLKDANTVTGKGDIRFNFIINNFLEPATPIVGKTLDIVSAAAAGFNGLDNNVYSIDFESKYKATIKQILFDNMSAWFDNTISSGVNLKDKANNADSFIPGDLKYTYNTNSVTISGNFMSWNTNSLNPHDTLNPIVASITIKGEWGNVTNSFNQKATIAKGVDFANAIDINNVAELRVLKANDPTLGPKLLTYMNANKDVFFENCPDAFSILGLSVSQSDVNQGMVRVSVTVKNVKIQAQDQNDLGYDTKTYNIHIKGFFAPIDATIGKNIDLGIINQPGGITSLTKNAFVFDFVNNNSFKQEFIASFKKDPSVWLNNYPSAERVSEFVNAGNQIIDESSINITKELKFATPALVISGRFVSWNHSGNKNDSLELLNQTIVIYNFNKNDTSTDSYQLSDIGGIELNNSTLSAQDAINTLNAKKEEVKQYFANSIDDLMVVVKNAPSTLKDTLLNAINNKQFEFVLDSDSKIKVVFNNIDQASNNGLDKLSQNLEIKISNKFNSIDLNTKFTRTVINWNDPDFTTLLGDASKFAFDWKVNKGPNPNNLTQFKILIMDNIKDYFIIENGPTPTNSKETELVDVTFTTTSNTNFINEINDLTAKLTITYKGYVNGTWKEDATTDISVNLKPIPDQNQIIDEINNIVKNELNGNYLISDSTYDDVIKNHGEEIFNTIKNSLQNFLPQSVVIEKNVTNTNDMFEMKKDENNVSIALKPNSIVIKPSANVGPTLANKFGNNGQILVPKNQYQVLIISKVPKAEWLEWVIYVIIGGTFVTLILTIVIYELYAKKKREMSSKTFGYSA